MDVNDNNKGSKEKKASRILVRLICPGDGCLDNLGQMSHDFGNLLLSHLSKLHGDLTFPQKSTSHKAWRLTIRGCGICSVFSVTSKK
jgi:hypothetical protein